MNYMEKVEQSISLFHQLPESISQKEVKSIEEEMKDNDVALHLLELLKDEDFLKEDFDLPKATPMNSGKVRLQNYHSFKKSIEKMKNAGAWDFNGLRFAMRHTDEEEQKVYRAIVRKQISIADPGPSKAESLVTNKASTTIQEGNQGVVETKIVPKDAPQDVEVISLDTDIATVELLKERKGKKVWAVKGVAQGNTTLLFSAEADPAISKEVKVTVKNTPKPISENEDK